MAGAGKKTFTAGETLTASDVNTYLMEQSVMVFGGTAARSSAIPTPSEGMFAVTTDNDELDYYDGSAWVPAVPVGAWQSWAPTLSGGWLNGNGTWVARYAQSGKTVFVQGFFTLGTTTTKGTNLNCSLPVSAAVSAGQPSAVFGIAAGQQTQLLGYFSNTSTLTIRAINVSATYAAPAAVTATVPATWVTNDYFTFNFSYEAA